MNAISPVIESHAFRDKDFVGGDTVLDFVNTITGRNGLPRDWLASFQSLTDWAALAGLLTKQRCARLRKMSRQSLSDAASALGSARDLRELLFRALTAAVNDRSPAPADLKHLHGYWCRAIESHAFQYADRSIQPVLRNSSCDLNDIGDAIVIRAVDLLRELRTKRLRLCAGPNCAWLFIDSSKAGRRRWCDMATCGNDAKAKRHYLARQKQSKTKAG